MCSEFVLSSINLGELQRLKEYIKWHVRIEIHKIKTWNHYIISDPPTVNAMSQQHMIEGENFSVACLATTGNPRPTTVYWTKEEDQEFRQNGSILQLKEYTTEQFWYFQMYGRKFI